MVFFEAGKTYKHNNINSLFNICLCCEVDNKKCLMFIKCSQSAFNNDDYYNIKISKIEEYINEYKNFSLILNKIRIDLFDNIILG